MTVDLNGIDFTSHDLEVLCDAALAVSRIESDELGRWSLSEPYSKSLMQEEVEAILESGPSTEVVKLSHRMLNALRLQRSTDPKWVAGHDQLTQAVNYYAPKIRLALQQMVNVKQIAKSGNVPTKLKSKDVQNLRDLVSKLHHDGYLVGYKLAQDKLLKRAKSDDFGKLIGNFSWDSWQPGDPATANLLSDAGPGLSGLLEDSGVTIKDVSDTQLAAISDALSGAAESGQSVDDIQSMLEELGLDPNRADLIATTELARAVSAGTQDAYQANGIEQFNWLPAEDACELCIDQADGSPYDTDSDEMPPLHPRCRCAVTPITGATEADVPEEDSGE